MWIPVRDDRPAHKVVLPLLSDRNHGTWYFDCAVPTLPGPR
jgi:hypothetical protein